MRWVLVHLYYGSPLAARLTSTVCFPALSLFGYQNLACHSLGMNFWPDEGIMTHSLHTAVIDQHGSLLANLEGNKFTAGQLGDLVETVMNRQ